MEGEVTALAPSGGEICRAVLDDLPQWFALPEAKENYVAAAARLPTFIFSSGREAVGFLCVKRQTVAASEIFVMGVKRKAHRQGVGRALVSEAQASLRAEGVRWLTVKTLGAVTTGRPL